MDSKVIKARLLAAFFAGIAVVSLAWAGVTNLDSLELSDSLTVEGLVTANADQAIKIGGTITAGTTVPSAAGILAIDSSNLLYISTGTLASQWAKVGAQ